MALQQYIRRVGIGSIISINTHIGWFQYYVARFNKNQHPDAAHLAMYYLLLHLALDEGMEGED